MRAGATAERGEKRHLRHKHHDRRAAAVKAPSHAKRHKGDRKGNKQHPKRRLCAVVKPYVGTKEHARGHERERHHDRDAARTRDRTRNGTHELAHLERHPQHHGRDQHAKSQPNEGL